MIQLATDPNASRSNWHPAAGEARDTRVARTTRSHAWPFISRQAERPAAPQDHKRATSPVTGS